MIDAVWKSPVSLRPVKRSFSCEPEFSEHWRAVSHSLTAGQDLWVNVTYLEALAGYTNALAKIPSVYALDQAGFTPQWRLMSGPEVSLMWRTIWTVT